MKENDFKDSIVRASADTNLIENIIMICNILTLIIIISLIIIILSHIKKKVLNDKNIIGIKRCIGFNKQQIYFLSILEITLAAATSFILGILLFYIIYILLNILLINPYLNIIFQIKIFLKSIILTSILIIGLPLLFGTIYLIKEMKSNIVSLIGRN